MIYDYKNKNIWSTLPLHGYLYIFDLANNFAFLGGEWGFLRREIEGGGKGEGIFGKSY